MLVDLIEVMCRRLCPPLPADIFELSEAQSWLCHGSCDILVVQLERPSLSEAPTAPAFI